MRRKITLTLVIILLIFSSAFSFTINSKDKLLALGYSEKEVSKLVTYSNFMTVGNEKEDKLNEGIKKYEKLISDDLGMDIKNISKSEYKVDYYDNLVKYYDENSDRLNKELELFKTEVATYGLTVEEKVNEYSLSEKVFYYSQLLSVQKQAWTGQLEEAKAKLVDLGVRQSEIDSYITGNLLTDIATLNEKVAYYESYMNTVRASGTSFAGGNMDLFNALNDYRVSIGMSRLAYNYDQQACVDKETIAYAQNKNPHNWLCTSLYSEGASLASVNSNYVQIAANFLTTDESHRKDVVSPLFSSMACSIVTNQNMNYMICGYFI